ncbi:UNVERIFIED_ORG: hypothetical protein GGI63_001096 [Rhizobium esperanzae]|uniref:hypothetical protein n=1 Tax=Rhizobium phaseoli TaxID=396 RepID=UPI0002F50E1E|nr:hypothetical protein [Rhizobium phaseoli]KEC73386.1 hypothetical protein RLPCCGM1_c1503 [Rhizobium leguminosarum bv. phaseoli CCGM1]PWI53328.1 hypothetical protein B5K03_13025 [Rhizobium phaseoli]
MNWNHWFRQIHRWPSVAFTAAVTVDIIAALQGKSTVWVGLLARLPLCLLMLTDLYLFLLPDAARRRGRWE